MLRRILSLLLLGLGLTSCMKGPTMGRNSPFQVIPFDHFSVEAQEFIPGLGPEDFHILVPLGKRMDQISLENGKFRRERFSLDQYGVGTEYSALFDGHGMFVFQGSGASYFVGKGEKFFWHHAFGSNYYHNGFARSARDGSTQAFYRYGGNKVAAGAMSELQLFRFYPDESSMECLVKIPDGMKYGIVWWFPMHDGFLVIRYGAEVPESDTAQFFGWDGKPAPHALAVGLNLLKRHNIQLREAPIHPDYGAFYPSQTKEPWGLFVWKKMPGQEKRRVFLLSVTDTVQAIPVTCDRMSLEPLESLQQIVVNPTYNVFVVAARENRDSDSTFLYLGRVRKDSTGKVYQAETFRLAPFPEMEHPLFSRNGQVLLFAMRDGVRTNLVFSRLVDLVADVNRRYPDAKFDLDDLK
jgi:hypothetical protein